MDEQDGSLSEPPDLDQFVRPATWRVVKISGHSRGEWEAVVVQAYILVQTEVGKARDVAVAIREIGGVVRVDAVTGPYEVVVLTEATDVDELGRMVVSKIQLVPGITRTITCTVVHL
jgi:DNA-binding Lrp family transcriptional regulator